MTDDEKFLEWVAGLSTQTFGQGREWANMDKGDLLRLCRMVRERDSKIDTLRELCDAREFVRGELLKIAVDALSDKDNHWHATNEIPNATRPCTACEALARIKGEG